MHKDGSYNFQHFRTIEDFGVSASGLSFDAENLSEIGLLETFKLFQVF